MGEPAARTAGGLLGVLNAWEREHFPEINPEINKEFAKIRPEKRHVLCRHVEGEGLLKERFLGFLLNMVTRLFGVGEPVDPSHASMRSAVSA